MLRWPRMHTGVRFALFICILAGGLLIGGAAAAQDRPEVTLLAPRDQAEISAEEILVRVKVRLPPGEDLKGIRALVDGRVATQARGMKLVATPAATGGEPNHVLSVPMPPRDCVLGILVEGSRTKSELVTVRLRWKNAAASSAAPPMTPPKLYILSIGVSDYRASDIRLRFAAKDARDLAAVFASQKKTLYGDVQSRVLTDQLATRDAVLDGLEWLQRQTTAKDVAVLFLAGHGITDPSTGAYYFLPFDADLDAIKRSMVPEAEIRTTLASIKGKVLLFLDTCHSGKIYSDTQTRGVTDLSPFISELASAENGVIVFAASTGRQASHESESWNNGAFTKSVVEGLRGRADIGKSGRITLNMLDLYISERVKQLTGGRQTPTTAKPSTVPDFPLAVVREVTNDDVDVAR